MPPVPDPGAEVVAIVDAVNRVVGAAPRARMRAGGLPHRATYVFVFGSDGRLLVQRRTTTKDVYPGHHDLAAGGVVLAGESYDASAAREAEEELGIAGVALRARFDLLHRDAGNVCWGRIYTCVCDGPFRLQPEEVAAVEFATLAEVGAGRFAPVTPDSAAALAELARRGGLSTRAARG